MPCTVPDCRYSLYAEPREWKLVLARALSVQTALSKPTCQVTSHNCFTLQDFTLADQHRSTFQVFAVCFSPLLNFGRHSIQIICDEMVWQDRRQLIEPVFADARQELAFVWNAL